MYQFTNRWFEQATKGTWEQLLSQTKPARILEIGSYEGASACYLIDTLASQGEIELHCVDTWEGGIEHNPGGIAHTDMGAVERRFNQNIRTAIENAQHRVDLRIHKGLSEDCLTSLISSGKKEYFDFIYVDGSHQAPDVLSDAILGFKLLKIGGIIAFDDYLWFEGLPHGKDPIRCPKPAIDAFTNIFCRKIHILSAPLYQLYIQKIAS